MAVKFESVQAGETLYDNHRTKMGNTTITRMGEWPVRVIEVTPDGAWVSWNHNPKQFWSRSCVSRLYRATLAEREAKRKARAK